VEYLALNVEQIFKKMQQMFDHPIGRLERRKKFEARKWHKEKSFSEYCHSKIILGNQVPIPDYKIVDYLIDEIPLESLQIQAKMYSFLSVVDIIKAFNRIKLKRSQATKRENAQEGDVKKKPDAGKTSE